MVKIYSNINEHFPYVILRKTAWSTGSRIEKPSRLVLISFKRPDKKPRYAIRWQTKPKSGPIGNGPTFGGDTFNDYTEANLIFTKVYLDHNTDYGRGNPSHLPGIFTPRTPVK